ncbi:MAG TPA: hypothetical protein VK181_07160 [Rhizobium sp.]|nr:hypothetical protein [Rhizobium sp.]
MSTPPLFIVAREFVAYACEAYFSRNDATYGRFMGRRMQLGLVTLPQKAEQYVDRIEDLLYANRYDMPQKWDELSSLLTAFTSYINAELESTK